jgi:serine/threonine protein kinase
VDVCAGGGGSVYLGVWQGNTDVAIKVVDSPSPAQQKSFVREIMILKACHHPNIIQ